MEQISGLLMELSDLNALSGLKVSTYFNVYDVKGQIQHNALRVSLSSRSHCVALQLLTGDANIPLKGPT